MPRPSGRSWSCALVPAGGRAAWPRRSAGRTRPSIASRAGTPKNRRERQPRPPANRYEYATVGALVHLDTKQLARFWQIGKRVYQDGVHRNRRVGWQHAHVAIDDHSRMVICELYPAEDAVSCSRFLELVIAHYADRGIPIERVMTDNGNGYRSHAFRDVLARHHIRHLRTKPYTPRTNGKRKRSSGPATRMGVRLRLPTQAPTAPAPCPATSAGTSTTDPTAPSTATHQPAASHRQLRFNS